MDEKSDQEMVDVTRENVDLFGEFLGQLAITGLKRYGAVTLIFDNEGCLRLVPTPRELVLPK